MTKVNPSSGKETKSDIFQWVIFKSYTISFISENIKLIQLLSKSKFLSFTTKVNANNVND